MQKRQLSKNTRTSKHKQSTNYNYSNNTKPGILERTVQKPTWVERTDYFLSTE